MKSGKRGVNMTRIQNYTDFVEALLHRGSLWAAETATAFLL
jgi:hypothetical protein